LFSPSSLLAFYLCLSSLLFSSFPFSHLDHGVAAGGFP
jgi:hypothetical protein